MKVKKKTYGPLGIAASLLILASCQSQVVTRGGGSAELELSGSIRETSTDGGESTDEVNLGVGYSAYTSPDFSIGFKMYANASTTGDSDSGSTALLVSPRWYFGEPDGDFAPYVGPDIGTSEFTSDENSISGTSLGGVAGVKFFHWDSAAPFTEIYTLDTEIEESTMSESGLRFGISVFF